MEIRLLRMLFQHGRFLSCIQMFLQLDSGTPQGVTQQVTHKVAQHLIGTSHSENVKLLNSVIQVGSHDRRHQMPPEKQAPEASQHL